MTGSKTLDVSNMPKVAGAAAAARALGSETGAADA